jgi:hypothetical protein
MTLADLLATLQSRALVPASRAKDLKTSLRYLAHALGYPDLDQCPVDAVCREEATWAKALETHFAALTASGRVISAVTMRNTRNNCRVTFRLAEAHGLLTAPLPPRLLTQSSRTAFRRQQQETAPYRTSYSPQTGPRYFSLPQAEWPPDITEGWQRYRAKCGLRLRETTFRTYAKRLATYLGYVKHIANRLPTWDGLFDVAALEEFLRWHGSRVQRPYSAQGRHLVTMIAAMAHVLEHPAHRALNALSNTLPPPAPLHNKRMHWVSLRELEEVAEDCLREGRSPVIIPPGTLYGGQVRASRFQRGLILKLLVRIPLRQRNVRELRQGEHLFKDHAGHWQLRFQGGDLKVSTRGGQVNVYNVDLTDYCPELLPALTEFLTVHRPKLRGAATSPFLFLTQRGLPFSQQSLRVELADAVAMRTGQRFYPHLIRTIWATEYIEEKRDFTGAAYMLGDNVATVLRAYQHILGKDQQAKAKAFLSTALQG